MVREEVSHPHVALRARVGLSPPPMAAGCGGVAHLGRSPSSLSSPPLPRRVGRGGGQRPSKRGRVTGRPRPPPASPRPRARCLCRLRLSCAGRPGAPIDSVLLCAAHPDRQRVRERRGRRRRAWLGMQSRRGGKSTREWAS